MTRPAPPPEAVLIEAARKRVGVAVRKIAPEAGITEARWRQLVKGYASAGRGQTVSTRAPADTLARMARAVGVTAEQLHEVDRDDAADILRNVGAVRQGDPIEEDDLRFMRPEGISDEEWARRKAKLAGYWDALLDEKG